MSLFGYQFGFMSKVPAPSGGVDFDFSSIGTLEVWLDARDTASITLSGFSGNTINTWANKVTGKPVIEVGQPSFGSQPALVYGTVNGKDAIRFDGNDVMNVGASPVSGNPVYIYVLAQRTGSFAGDMGLVGIYDSGATLGYWDLNLNSGNFVVFDVSGTVVTDTFAMGTGGAHIAWGRQTGTTSQDAGLDGSITNLVTTPISPVTNGFIIGDTLSGSGFIGDITTILVYSALTSMEHSTVITELAIIGGVP